MNWTKGDTGRVLHSDNGFLAIAFANPGSKDGYIASIFKNPDPLSYFVPFMVADTTRWGGTIETTLRICVKAFDSQAVFID